MGIESTTSQQAKRLIFMLKKFQNGKVLSAQEMRELINENFPKVTLRTVQRDLRVLQDCEETLETDSEGHTILYYIPRSTRPGAPVSIGGNDLLSLHILKAHLKTFKGTVIEENTKHLQSQLEELAPSNVYAEDSIYWNKNIGQFNYSDYDKIIRRIIHYTSKGEWVKVLYRKLENINKPEKYEAVLKSVFTYFGYLYVASFSAKHNKFIVFAIHRIDDIVPVDRIPSIKVPKFDYNRFLKSHFGVFGGTPKNVVLQIKAEYAHYFENRFWHDSQKFEKSHNGDLILKLKVPIVTDFVSWVFSWSDVITVIGPKALKERIIQTAENTISNYYKGKK